MASFKLTNGKEGSEHVHHTATGYECAANYENERKEQNERIMFYVKHVVGADGRPYTEVGLSGLNDGEHENALDELKNSLMDAGMNNIRCLTEAEPDALVFAEHKSTDFDKVSVRVCAGTEGISAVVAVMGQMIRDTPRKFMQEQEQVPDVLFESILASMGTEMDRGPGGHDMAVEKAHALADQFLHGVSESALMS
jgi:hypothetical protein